MTRMFASLVLAAAIAAPVGAFAQTAAQDVRSTNTINAVVAKPHAGSVVDDGPAVLLNKIRDARPSMPTITTPVAGDKRG
ncbi:MAG TPA: hypothetical protein VND87_05765 [Stellaceae bacterium]|nr:hypothetical protein [Stellaceae bacterium]